MRRARHRRRPPLWAVYLLASVVLVAVFPVVDGDVSEALYAVTTVSAVVTTALVVVRRQRAAARSAWALLAAGLALQMLGDLVWSSHLAAGQAPFPSYADTFFLASYAALGLGVWRLARARSQSRFDVIDAAIVSVAIGLFTWVDVLSRAVAHGAGTARLLVVAFPLLSALRLSASIVLLLRGTRRSPAAVALAVASLVSVAADALAARDLLSGTYAYGGWVELGVMVSSAGMAVAALHPSMAAVGRPTTTPAATITRRRYILLVAAVAVGPAALAIPGEQAPELLIGVWFATFWMVVGRLWELTRRLHDHAVRDPLTGLANKEVLVDQLAAAIERLGRRRELAAVVFCDLDRFKLVNDTHGHSTGDELLKVAAARLQQAVRPGDVVARTGGDEFVVLLPRLTRTTDADEVAARVVACLSEPVHITGAGQLYPAVSVGVRLLCSPDEVPERVLADADTAMYAAKSSGRNRVARFRPEQRAQVSRRLRLDSELRRAIEAGQLHLHYQPEVELATGALYSFEALARWDHLTLGAVPPPSFVAAAEDGGFADRLFDWALETALAQHAAWRARGLVGPVAVNLSASQLADPRLVPAVRHALERFDVAEGQLCLELTESEVLGRDSGLVTMAALRSLGVRIAIDDFGTGWSSLAQLRTVPFDLLKIDRSFVTSLGSSRDDAVVAGIIDLAHRLGARTVAEGVETAAQAEALARFGCDVGQGYHFGRPMPPDEAIAGLGADGCWLLPDPVSTPAPAH